MSLSKITPVRRVVVLLVVALVGAGFAGRLVGADAVRAGHLSISSSTFRAQIAVLASSPVYSCYLQSELGGIIQSNGVVSPSGSTEWAKVQVEALAFESLLASKYHWHPSNKELGQALAGLLNDFDQSASALAASSGTGCGPTATVAFSKLPKWFQRSEVLRNAASIALLQRIGTVTPLTQSGVAGFFAAHRSAYDTICISIAFVPSAQFRTFEKTRTSGATVASLARAFSADPSAKKGGAYGCLAPGSTSYSSVRRFVLNEPLNQFSPRYQPQQTQNGIYLLYVAATKRTPNSLAGAFKQVIADIQGENSNSAALAERHYLQISNVAVDPALGRWSYAKVTVLTPHSPALKFVANAGAGLTK